MNSNTREYCRIIVNSVTDPGVLFNFGNIIVSAQHSFEAAILNATVASTSFAVRAANEMKSFEKTALFVNKLGKNFNRFARNKGAALVTSGSLTLASAALTLSEYFNGSSEALLASGMLACFGLVHVFRGVATDMQEGIAKNTFDASAFVAAVSGYIFANPDLPVTIKGAYVSIAALAIYMALKNKKSEGLKQPDIYFASTSYLSALFADNAHVAIGFASWASGYLSINAMRKKGGVYEALEDFFVKKTDPPQP